MINWGLAAGGNNALASFGQGMQLGTYIRGQREEKERKNALAAFATDQSEENFARLAEVAPEYAIKERERMDARNAKAAEGQLVQAALGGDPAALRQLATVNFDTWRTLDTQQRETVKQEADIYGNAAMDVLRLPPNQRAQAVMAYADRLGSAEIAELANLPPQELEAALRAQIAESGMIKELHAMERPSYMAVPYDSTLVNTRDPAAVAQFGASGGQSQGAPIQITGEADYNALPPGAEYIDPQGNRRVKGGTAGNGGGTFQP